jgi:hypothetical protein
MCPCFAKDALGKDMSSLEPRGHVTMAAGKLSHHASRNASVTPNLCRYDEANHERFPVGDPNKRAFTYFVLTGSRFMYASAMRLVVLKFILSWAVCSSLSLHL